MQARHPRYGAGKRVARCHSSGDRDGKGRALPGKTFPLTLGGCTRDHRNALVRPPFLWSPNLIGGVKTWNQIAAPSGVARSTRAKVPRKASSRDLATDLTLDPGAAGKV